MPTMVDLTGSQVRMARAALGWTQSELAHRAVVGIAIVQAIEATDGVVVASREKDGVLEHPASARAAVEAIRKALADAGITFLPDNGSGAGIRWKPTTMSKREST